MSRPHGRARVRASSPEAFGCCDRCGRWWNLADLRWNYQWAGNKLQNENYLMCRSCIDVPQPQLQARVLPPDPVPVNNPRPERSGS